jgi:hypothetical protein
MEMKKDRRDEQLLYHRLQLFRAAKIKFDNELADEIRRKKRRKMKRKREGRKKKEERRKGIRKKNLRPYYYYYYSPFLARVPLNV